MPLMHCQRCHHEWEGHEGDRCSWCEGESYVLAERTGLEQLTREKMDKIVKDVNRGKRRS